MEDGRVTGSRRAFKARRRHQRARRRDHRRRRSQLRGGGSRPAGEVQRAATTARSLLFVLERSAHERPLRKLHSTPTAVSAVAPTHDGLTMISWRMAVRRVQREQTGPRRQLSQAVRACSRVRAATARCEARITPGRRADTEFLPQAVRTGLGARGGCRLSEGSDYGARDPGRIPRRRSLRARSGRNSAGVQTFDAAMEAYRQARDAGSVAMYDLTCQLASMAPPPPEMRQLFAAMAGNQKAMNGFAQMNAGTISPRTFSRRRMWAPFLVNRERLRVDLARASAALATVSRFECRRRAIYKSARASVSM